MRKNTWNSRLSRIHPMVWISFLIIIIYAPVISYQFSLDDFLVTEPIVGKISTLSDAFGLWTQRFNKVDYRPVSLFSFALEYLIFGNIYPGISHFINVVLWLAVILVGYKLLQQITENKHEKIVFWTVILFSCLPINVEMVASIKSRDNLFSLLFTFLSLRCLTLPLIKENALAYFWGFLLGFLALSAKLDAAGIMLFLPLYHLLIIDYKTIFRQVIAAVFSFVLASILVNLLRMNLLYYFIAPADVSTDIGKVTFTENPAVALVHFSDKIATALYTNFIYLQKILVPYDLRFYYGFNYYELPGLYTTLGILLTLFHLVALAILAWAIYRKHKVIIIGIIGYIGFIAYALNLVFPMAGVVADRYAAQACIWIMLFITSLLFMLPKKAVSNTILYGMIVLFVGTSAYRVSAWQNSLALIERDAPHLQNSYEGMRIAASIYKVAADTTIAITLKNKYIEKALNCAQNANKIYPNNTIMNTYEGSYWFELGYPEKAIDKFRTALKTDAHNANALIFMADVFYTKKQLDSALFYYQIAFKIASSNSILINNISTVYYESGQKNEALNFNRALLKQDTTIAAAWENIGYFYLAEKDSALAIQNFKMAVKYGIPTSSIPISLK